MFNVFLASCQKSESPVYHSYLCLDFRILNTGNLRYFEIIDQTFLYHPIKYFRIIYQGKEGEKCSDDILLA